MKSRYVDSDARNYTSELRQRASETLALRTYTSRLLGADPALVLHGGGNTSAKGTEEDVFGQPTDVLYIKGSGWDLATLEPAGLPAVRLAPLQKLRALDAMTDEAMVNELRLNLLDASAPTPSVETLLHAFLPARFIDHTHADAVLAVADQPEAEKVCRGIFGPSMVWVPYVMPGFALAKRCAAAYDAMAATGRKPGVIVLERHGVFTFGETAKESYEAMIEAVSAAERYVDDARRTASFAASPRIQGLDAAVLPRLRGALAKVSAQPRERGPIFSVRANDAVLAFLKRPDVNDLVEAGCATPDHVIRTKPTALLVTAPDYGDPDALGKRLEEEIVRYARIYDAYVDAMCAEKRVKKTRLDPWPRVVLLPGFGLCAIGKTQKEADVVADVYEHTIEVMSNAADVGRYAPVGRADLFDVEYWSLEQAKVKKTSPLPLGGAIAVVTGAASGIGLATVERFLALGAHVGMVDRDAAALAAARASLAASYASQLATAVADVTSWRDVSAAFGAIVARFGGVDVVVSNAGTAPEGRLDEEAGDDALRRSLEVNLLAHNHVARAAADVMLPQQRGGCLLFNASKSAFNPGPGFGPYAVAKTALVALMRQHAIDLGPRGIRANAVNADRIRTNLFAGGVAESRAAARGLTVDDYFTANLLKREVTGRDVADAFAYLAQAPSTTGCVITVDGGNAAAFPR